MTSNEEDALREQLRRLLDWEDAHVSFDLAVLRVPKPVRGKTPSGSAHSLWQLLEHMRICQLDILDFCRSPNYVEMAKEDYWPRSAAPPSEEAWAASIAAFRRDREELKKMAENRSLDLFARIPHGTGQTYLRELMLVADHNAYHLGQFVALRRRLGAWSD
jgi:uncharacterized damage-inducible protein DinB